MHRTLLILVVWGLLLGTPTSGWASDLVPANAWIRWPVADEAPAGYFVIQNRGERNRTLVAASCEGCAAVEIHRAIFMGGAMTSEVLSEWELPAGGAVAFAPRGLSLLLRGLSNLQPKQTVEIQLEFADGETVALEAVVREP